MKVTEKDKTRFFAKVKQSTCSECLEWQASTHRSSRYGTFKLNGKSEYAHRVAFVISKGKIPDDLFVLHKCDNRKCVNPDHLFLGTNTDNMRDMINKGRGNKARGSANGCSKLTEEAVMDIRRRYAAGGVLQKELAEEYSVTTVLISQVVLNKFWRHVPV